MFLLALSNKLLQWTVSLHYKQGLSPECWTNSDSSQFYSVSNSSFPVLFSQLIYIYIFRFIKNRLLRIKKVHNFSENEYLTLFHWAFPFSSPFLHTGLNTHHWIRNGVEFRPFSLALLCTTPLTKHGGGGGGGD